MFGGAVCGWGGLVWGGRMWVGRAWGAVLGGAVLGGGVGTAPLSACRQAPPANLSPLVTLTYMLRSYPVETSPSHQNWELKRQ